MYITNKERQYTIPLKTKWIWTKLYLNTENQYDFQRIKRLRKQQKIIDLSSMMFDILVNLKRQNTIYLGGIQSILLTPYDNKIFIRTNKKTQYTVENLTFQEDYIFDNIWKYYHINKPILYKWKTFFKLKPVYAIILAIKENKDFADTTYMKNFIKNNNITKQDILNEIKIIIKDKNIRSDIIKIIDILYSNWIFKIKLKYNNADQFRFDKFIQLLEYLFSNVNITNLRTKLNQYYSLKAENILYWNSYFYFWEAYFSNYIEWTKFEVSEAKKIIEWNTEYVWTERENDTHHVKNYYNTIKQYYPNILNDNSFIKKLLTNNNNWKTNILLILKNIHKNILFHTSIWWNLKQQKNMVSSYIFVFPEKVEDTLKMAIELFVYYYNNSALKLSNKEIAIILFSYIHFVITEIHPFTDWNWRVTRILTNMILISVWLSPIIVTDIMRKNYTWALKYMSEWKADIYTDKIYKILNYQINFDYSTIENNETMLKEISDDNESWFGFDPFIE